MEVGELYFEARGFVYECVEETANAYSMYLINPNKPTDHRKLFLYKNGGPNPQGYTLNDFGRVDTDYLKSAIGYSVRLVKHYSEHLTMERNAIQRFNEELEKRGELDGS